MLTRPLDNFPVIRSRNAEEVREAIGRIYAKPALLPASAFDRLNTVINNCRLRHVELAYSLFGGDVSFEYPETGYFSVLFPMQGAGEIICGKTSAPLSRTASTVVSSQAIHTAKFSADYEHLILRISARTLVEKLTALTGSTIGQHLRIDPLQDSRSPGSRMLQQYLPLLVNTLSEASPPFPDRWIAQTEQLLITLFLFGYRHNYSHLLEDDPPDAAPAQVRRAEEYIEANGQRAVTIEELAEITGVSAFSLFRAFRQHRGYSPTQFMRRLNSSRTQRR
jgi:hypothetical protein